MIIGGLFILEMTRGRIPSSFALPARDGDIILGLVVVSLVLGYQKIPK